MPAHAIIPGAFALVVDDDPEVRAVVTDVHMPGPMNGLAQAAIISQRWPSIAMLVTSGGFQGAAGEGTAAARLRHAIDTALNEPVPGRDAWPWPVSFH